MRPRLTPLPSRGSSTGKPSLRERLPRFVAAAARTTQPRLLFALMALSLVGWINLPANGDMSLMASLCGGRGLGFTAATRGLFDLRLASAGRLIADGGWMLLAMSPPLLVGPIGSLWTLTSRQRRPAAVAALLLGYGAVWSLALPLLGVLMLGLAIAAELLHVAPLLLGLVVALAWQFGSYKRAAIALCRQRAPHRGKPSPSLGASFTFGIVQARGCVGACWAAMTLPMLVAGDQRPLAALVACLLFIERVVSSTAAHGDQ